LWQGPVPPELHLLNWLYLKADRPTMAVLWEGDADAVAYMERAFGGFGAFTTAAVTEDATPGLAAAFARDLEGFGDWMRARGASDVEIERALDVRRRGRDSPDQAAAAEAGRAWAAGT
jgi:hypothetical protein